MNANASRFLKTKVVCTIGPASSSPAILRALCLGGMDVARLNMSHSSAAMIRETAGNIRDCARELGRPVTLLLDLQGPKVRVGRLSEPRLLQAGDRIELIPAMEAVGPELPVTYERLANDVTSGDRVLIDDGRIELRVRKVEPPRVTAEVLIGGEVIGGKGINLPGVRVSAPALTEKDLVDLKLVGEIGAEYVALSFVRSAADLYELKKRLPHDVLVVAKIEKGAALAEFDDILEASDAVMVARGDLGSELPFEQVPLVQKTIVRKANARFRPVIIATEMLESMIERPRPTRAEVSDAANAVLDGADALMLSAETAVGRYPAESVTALTRVIREIESAPVLWTAGPAYDVPDSQPGGTPSSTEVAIACATLEAVRAVQAPAIVTFTKSGQTARVVSSRRPPVPVLAVTDTETVFRQLALVWGVLPVCCAPDPSYEDMWETARRELLRRGLAHDGDRIVITAGAPFQVRGTTNTLRIEAL